MALQFRTIKHPPFELRLIPDDQNGAWDDLGIMEVVGDVRHTMVGTKRGTDLWFRRGASSTGLTTYGVGLDGSIWMWNDPTGKPAKVKIQWNAQLGLWVYGQGTERIVSPRRAGWANGGSDGLEGDGPAFVRAMGVNGINRNLVSIERDDNGDPYNTPYKDPQAKSIDQIIAYWFDQADVPWDSFPINPKIGGGIVTDFFHLEFATKGCPWGPVIENINASQDRVRAMLKAAQTETAEGPPLPPATPIEPDDSLPNGWTFDLLDTRFGTLTRRKLDGTIIKSGFNKNGAISNAWMGRGIAEGRSVSEMPPASYMAEMENAKIVYDGEPATAAVILFDGRGADNWVLYRPDNSIAWRWMI